MLVSAVPINALSAIVNEWDEQLNVIDDSAKLPLKAPSSIDSTDIGMSTEVKYDKANAPKSITFKREPSSNVTDATVTLSDENASGSILVVAAGTIRWPSCTLVASRAYSIFRQLAAGIAKPFTSYGVLWNAPLLMKSGWSEQSYVTVSNNEFANASVPISCTYVGIRMDDNFESLNV
jgi:hypothetical protein